MYKLKLVFTKTLKKGFLFCLLFFSINSLFSAAPDTFEFVNQDLRDIVYILSMRSGKSIICDDTVSGTGNFMYVMQEGNDDFDKVFDAFLYSNKLFVIKTENLWTVSKIKIEKEDDDKISINSYDSTPAAVFEKLSEKSGKAILWDNLPIQKASFHIKNQTVYEIVRLILQPYSEYTVTNSVSGIQITRTRNGGNFSNLAVNDESLCNVSCTNDKFDVLIKNTNISEVLEKIFTYCEQSYSNFLVSDEKVRSVSFSQKNLNDTLLLVLEQINAEPVFTDDICYIFPQANRSNRDSVMARNRFWHTVNVQNMTSAKLIPLITTKFQGINVTDLSSSLFAVFATDSEWESIKDYVMQFDGSVETQAVHLKYIKTSELLNALPPSVAKEEIADTGTGNSFFYTGSIEKRERFLEQLKEIDKPKKLVRYDLLILQYEKSSNLSWGISSSVRPSEMGDRTLLSGEIGNLLNINFDAITAFGLTFSEKINTAIANNDAAVFADTTLYGLSGEKLTFKNTNTYRYKDVAINSETGKEAYSTITREITSGLVLEIDGWVSGDDIITMQISTSVSKQGVDVSKKTGNPPPTSEKNITTKIRARNGEPVVLSGLSQSDFSQAEQGVPFISKIPFLGNLFKSKDVSNSKTEMTIYLLPHIEENPTEEIAGNWKQKLLEYLEQTTQKGGEEF